MDQFPFAFVDSVAHLISKNSAEELSHFSSDVWSSVGKIHQDKRVEYYIDVGVVANEAYYQLRNNGVPTTISAVLNSDYKYARILRYCLSGRDSLPFNSKLIELDEFCDLVNRIPVKELALYDVHSSTEQNHFLWKIPVEIIYCNRQNVSAAIIEYHLFENEFLKTFKFGHPSYNFVVKCVESFKMERIQVEKNKRKRLSDLGFAAKSQWRYELKVEARHNGKVKSVRFCTY